MNLRLRILLVIFTATAVISTLLILLPSPESDSRGGERLKREAECAHADFFDSPGQDNALQVKRKLAECWESVAKGPFTFYPLYLPNFRRFVQRLLRGEAMDRPPINGALATMRFPAVPLLAALRRLQPQPLGLQILVKSAAGNLVNRVAYRSTWANPEYLKGIDIPVAHAFLVGIGQFEGKVPPELVAESSEHRDIIFQDFVESYRNNTYKTMGGLKWAVERGPPFEFLVIIDDDIYFSVVQAARLLKFPEEFPMSPKPGGNTYGKVFKYGMKISSGETFLAGSKMEGTGPIRDPAVRSYYLSWDEYPLESFTPYCSGMATFFSAATAREIYEASLFVKLFPVDDAFIGLVAMKLGIEITNIRPAVIPSYDSQGPFPTQTELGGVPLIARHVPLNVSLRLSYWHQMHSES